MRFMLRGLITPSWENVALEMAVSAVGNTYYKKDTLGQGVAQFNMTW